MTYPYDLILVIAVVAVALTVLVLHFTRARRRGRAGERKVARLLKRCMIAGDRLVNDLYLADPRDKSRSAQIDHVLLSVRGIFVVETKNYSGDIYGDDGAYQWTQALADGNVVHEFYNPVKQNAAHIAALKKALGTDVRMENLVVFVQGNIGKIASSCVCSPQGLKSRLASIRRRRILTEKERDAFYEILKEAKQNPSVSKRRHKKNVRRRRR